MTAVREPRDDAAVLYVEGPLRGPVNAGLRLKVEGLLRRGKRRILVNLAEVSDLDAAGVGELVEVHNLTAAANGTLRITHARGRVRELLARLCVLDLLQGDRALHSEGDMPPPDRPEPGDGQRI